MSLDKSVGTLVRDWLAEPCSFRNDLGFHQLNIIFPCPATIWIKFKEPYLRVKTLYYHEIYLGDLFCWRIQKLRTQKFLLCC